MYSKPTNGVSLLKQDTLYHMQPFAEFIENFRSNLHSVFYERANINELALTRKMPPFVMREIMGSQPLTIAIPKKYGGRGINVEEILTLLSVASYESLALSLTFGINIALFLTPVAKYGQENVKSRVFEKFVHHQNMGGLMITEPDYGSDALNMKTSYKDHGDHYHISGTKHWAGLTGWADYWLVTAREQARDGNLQRDIDFFIVDQNIPGQQIEVEEVYSNIGLYHIPYGKNKINLNVPKDQRLIPESTGLKMMLDILHRSRIQFPGMALGFIQRMLDDSIEHSHQRMIGRQTLFEYDQVQHRISKLQSYFTVCSALCLYSTRNSSIDMDMSVCALEANSVKTVMTDMMQEAAQSATQLVGAQAYKHDSMVGRGIMDSRPFQIFEGSNDILYAQIAENVVKMMKKVKQNNLYIFLSDLDLTAKAAPNLKSMINFDFDLNMAQRKLVQLGQVVSRIVAYRFVIDLEETPFRKDLIYNGLNILKQEISALMSVYQSVDEINVVDDYRDNSSWLECLTA